jgi:hypothetical protein
MDELTRVPDLPALPARQAAPGAAPECPAAQRPAGTARQMSDSAALIGAALRQCRPDTWNDCQRFVREVVMPNLTGAEAREVVELLAGHGGLLWEAFWDVVFHAPWTPAQWQAWRCSAEGARLGSDASLARYRDALEKVRHL